MIPGNQWVSKALAVSRRIPERRSSHDGPGMKSYRSGLIGLFTTWKSLDEHLLEQLPHFRP
jgi:hypothetical protein